MAITVTTKEHGFSSQNNNKVNNNTVSCMVIKNEHLIMNP